MNPYRLVEAICKVITVCDTWDDTKLLGKEFFPCEYKRLRQFLYTLGFPIFMRGLDYIIILHKEGADRFGLHEPYSSYR